MHNLLKVRKMETNTNNVFNTQNILFEKER